MVSMTVGVTLVAFSLILAGAVIIAIVNVRKEGQDR